MNKEQIRRVLDQHGVRVLGERDGIVFAADVVIDRERRRHTHAKAFTPGCSSSSVYEWLGY